MSKSVWPRYVNTGTPVKLSDLKPGQYFRYNGYPNDYRLLEIMPGYLKIKRPDGWYVHVSKTNELYNQIVYVDNN